MRKVMCVLRYLRYPKRTDFIMLCVRAYTFACVVWVAVVVAVVASADSSITYFPEKQLLQ